VHAILLAGGSAFGLEAASGVRRYLAQRGVGYLFGGSTFPSSPPRFCSTLESASRTFTPAWQWAKPPPPPPPPTR